MKIERERTNRDILEKVGIVSKFFMEIYYVIKIKTSRIVILYR